MKRITLSADEDLIKQARLRARAHHKTLNELFLEWLQQFTSRNGNSQAFDALMRRLKHVEAGRHLSRNDTNDR